MVDLLIVLAFGLALALSVIWAFIEYLPHLRQSPGADPNGRRVRLDLYLYGDISTSPTTSRHIIVPSAGYFCLLINHLEIKKKELKTQWETSTKFKAHWRYESEASRRKKLESVKEELIFAVSGYIGKDMPLLDAICSDLQLDSLLAEKRGEDSFSRLLDRCLNGTLQEPLERDQMYWIIHRLIQDSAGKSRELRQVRGRFLPVFRRLCIYSFCIRVLEDYDGSALVKKGKAGGPTRTVQSIIQAAISAGAVTLLVLATKHFLNALGVAPHLGVDGSMGIPSL